jgi:hypothetical protein
MPGYHDPRIQDPPPDAVRQDLGRSRRQRTGRRSDPLYRPAPDPRGDHAAGLRRASRGRPQGAPARPHAGRGRPQHPHRGPGPGRRRRGRRGSAPAAEDPGPQRPGQRHRVLPDGRHPQRDRPRGRPRAGPHPAGHDHRLRRQPHLDPRRLRGPGPRHRHLRGRARPGHPDPAPGEGQEHAGPRRRPAGSRRHRERHRPGRDRRDRHGRRHRLRHRIRRRGGPRPVDGRPHDPVQPDHRGRRQGRPGRARRQDLRLHPGQALGAEGRGLGHGAVVLEDASSATRTPISTAPW